MDDTEELAFHQETVSTDENTPLHLIREKEIEISGRVLSAKRQADEIVAEARKQAAGLLGAVQEEAAVIASKREQELRVDIDDQITTLKAQAEVEVGELQSTIERRLPDAVTLVVGAVTKVDQG